MNKCKMCDKDTKNNYFCSRSCSISYYNKLSPKRKKEVIICYCSVCNTIINKRRKFCDDCFRAKRNLSLTLKEYKKTCKGHYSAGIRDFARRVFNLSGKLRVCVKCGYSKHIEVCHIKPISSFSDDTIVFTISEIENLVALCPNCHWEYDAKLFDL